MNRRNLFKYSLFTGLFGMLSNKPVNSIASEFSSAALKKKDDRNFWIDELSKMASPILDNISKQTWRKNMPMIFSPTFDSRDPGVGYLEAFGRLLAGMAPWLSLPDDNSSEGVLRKKFREQALMGIQYGTDPNSPDYFSWNVKVGQPLVDAAHLAQAFLRAPKALWEPLPKGVKERVVHEFKQLRRIKPNESNWLLFAAMTETFLYTVGGEYMREKIDYAVNKFDKDWYVGDGWYSDGARFSFDHYNGYVIHCMQVETLKHILPVSSHYKELYDRAYKRMQRYAHHLERMISPEGYPLVVGRSSTYRTAAFQPLAAVILDNKLPEDVTKGQARAALTAVFKHTFVRNSYDKYGWLTMGVVGDKQTDLADYYTNAGSMYVASLAFLPLGLPASDEFWTSESEPWTTQKIWKGESFPKDYYVTY